MNEQLSSIQRKIMIFLTERVSLGKAPPTVREIGQAVSLRSTSSVYMQLGNLERKGYITRDRLKSRAIELVGMTTPIPQAPVVGRIRAGTPHLAQEDYTGFFPLPDLFRGKECFVLEVKGDSMLQAGIEPGDYVIVEQEEHATSGEIVVALIEEETTLKYFRQTSEGKIFLEAANPAYEPIYSPALKIIGRVVGLFRRL